MEKLIDKSTWVKLRFLERYLYVIRMSDEMARELNIGIRIEHSKDFLRT
jgi:hypothetical protein